MVLLREITICQLNFCRKLIGKRLEGASGVCLGVDGLVGGEFLNDLIDVLNHLAFLTVHDHLLHFIDHNWHLNLYNFCFDYRYVNFLWLAKLLCVGYFGLGD